MNNNSGKDPKWSDFTKAIKRLPSAPKRNSRGENKKEKQRAAIKTTKPGDKTESKKFNYLDDINALAEQAQNLPAAQTLWNPGSNNKKCASTFTRTMERKLKSGDILIEGKLDLHGMTQEQAHSALIRFIETMASAKKRTLLVITGKGQGHSGILRKNLENWLESSVSRNMILSIRHAAPKHGGTGAYYVILRKAA